MICLKRTYEPSNRGAGKRILVERLWPRGMEKQTLRMDSWLKDVAPSTELRRWFGHKPERWKEFRRRYEKELSANTGAWTSILNASGKGTVTLLYSAHDVEHNAAVVLRDFVVRKERQRKASRAFHN
jgi:uncharacterized protein YeaO (DUF488 family)